MKVGVISDLEYTRHHLFKSYYYSVKNLYKQDPVLVKSEKDLIGIDILFIGDDHYEIHKNVWMKCIDYCNKNEIQVIALTNEKVKNSFFPWNESNLQILNQFKHLYHYMNDVDDCIEYKCRLNRTAPSISFKYDFYSKEPKKYNYMVFIGKLTCPKNSYNERKVILNQLKKIIKVDVYDSSIPSWNAYLRIIQKYKYIFSPVGNGNFFPMRFYEALCINSIPVHQIRENTLDFYKVENTFEDVIFFKSVDEIKQKIEDIRLPEAFNKIWMEDNLEYNLKLDNLL